MLAIVNQAKRVQARTKSLIQLNLELATLEGKQKATALAIAAGLAAAAALFVLYAVGFIFAAAAAGLAEELPWWLSLLIVGVVLILLAAVAGLVAAKFAKKGSPPVPNQAIAETKRTIAEVRGHV